MYDINKQKASEVAKQNAFDDAVGTGTKGKRYSRVGRELYVTWEPMAEHQEGIPSSRKQIE